MPCQKVMVTRPACQRFPRPDEVSKSKTSESPLPFTFVTHSLTAVAEKRAGRAWSATFATPLRASALPSLSPERVGCAGVVADDSRQFWNRFGMKMQSMCGPLHHRTCLALPVGLSMVAWGGDHDRYGQALGGLSSPSEPIFARDLARSPAVILFFNR